MPKNDPRLHAETVDFPSPNGYGKARGYLVQPAHKGKAAARRPAVLVAHENRGLNPHIEDIARRLALEGFVAFAPDALTFSWELAAADTVAAGSRLDIETVPLAVRCSACGDESTPPVATGLACTKCGSGPTRIVRGRELELVAMEVPEQ